MLTGLRVFCYSDAGGGSTSIAMVFHAVNS
jgi:hypothetical protein